MSTEVTYNVSIQQVTPRTVIKSRNAQPQMSCTAEWITFAPFFTHYFEDLGEFWLLISPISYVLMSSLSLTLTDVCSVFFFFMLFILLSLSWIMTTRTAKAFHSLTLLNYHISRSHTALTKAAHVVPHTLDVPLVPHFINRTARSRRLIVLFVI